MAGHERHELLAPVGAPGDRHEQRRLVFVQPGLDVDAVEALAACLNDGHFAVRLAAAELLATHGAAAVGAIARRLEARSPTPLQKLAFLDALGQTRHRAAAVHIEPFLIDPVTRVHAARAYGSTAARSSGVSCAALLIDEREPAVVVALRAAQAQIEAAAGN